MGTQMRNGNLLVEPGDKNVKLNNSISMEVGSKSRRDIIFGTISEGEINMLYEPGDTVFFPKYAADDLVIGGKAFFVVKRDDVILIERRNKDA